MEIILKELKLENFKGVRNFSISPSGQGLNAVIEGMNGTGKTSQMDAFLWLLFNKDSQGKTDFSLKTLNADGSEMHNLNHSVEVVIDINGEPVRLKKVFSEKWTKKRGTSSQEFTGHSTDYFIDEVPVQKKKWDEFISRIISEDTLKLLTDPMYFNSLHWTKRRELLMDVCGNISDQDVINSDKSLSGLTDILKNRSIDDQKAIISSQKKKINDRLKEIPVRIDELNKSVADVSGLNVPLIEKKIKELDEIIQVAKSDKSSSILRSQRLDIQTKIRDLETKVDNIKRTSEKEASKTLETIQQSLRIKRTELANLDRSISTLKDIIKSNDDRLSSLRKDFEEYKNQVFQPGPEPQLNSDACPKCGYVLASEENEKRLLDYKVKTNEAEEAFKLSQAKAMQDINRKGKKLADENKEHNESIITKSTERDRFINQIKDLEYQEVSAQEKAKKVEYPSTIEPYHAEIAKLNNELIDLDKKIEGAIPADTSEQEARKRAEEVKLAQIESNKTTMSRIEELAKEEKKLAAEYERLEGELALIEKFIIQKVSLLEGKINGKFELARFKLFDTQINGGINEVCETLYNGVPFSSGLNTGAQINVGLDIIRTLSDHFGVKAPIFVDHAESVNKIIEAGSQMFHLSVSDDPELTVKYF